MGKRQIEEAKAAGQWAFNGDYHDYGQIQPFWDAYLERLHALKAERKYPYNDDFRGHLPGAEGPCEDTAIYLCQSRRHLADDQEKVYAAIAEGCEPIESVEKTTKFSRIVLYAFQNEETGFREFAGARLAPGQNGGMVVLPKGARTRGYGTHFSKVLVAR